MVLWNDCKNLFTFSFLLSSRLTPGRQYRGQIQAVGRCPIQGGLNTCAAVASRKSTVVRSQATRAGGAQPATKPIPADCLSPGGSLFLYRYKL
nr:MAG TPA: hypothetical protein [Caudoviricetes sp.]